VPSPDDPTGLHTISDFIPPTWAGPPQTPTAWPAPPRPASLVGLAKALYVLLALVICIDIGIIFARQHQRDVLWSSYHTEPLDFLEGLNTALYLVTAANILFAILLFGTGVVFITWLYRARINAEIAGTRPQRRRRGWVIWSWFTPGANLMIPYQIAADLLAAPQPAAPQPAAPQPAAPQPGAPQPGAPPGADSVPARRHGPRGRGYLLVRTWWAAWILTWTLAPLAHREGTALDLGELLRTNAWGMASAGINAVAAVLAALLVRRITAAHDPH
jgi:hypothetical protein